MICQRRTHTNTYALAFSSGGEKISCVVLLRVPSRLDFYFIW